MKKRDLFIKNKCLHKKNNLKTLLKLYFLILFSSILSFNNYAQVIYTLNETTYYTSFTDGGGIFSNGTELGMWANTSGNKQVVAWRQFQTNGTNSGTARSLQVGDVFTISVYASSALGSMGFSLNASPSTGSWANRYSNSRLYIEADGNSGSWYVNSSAGNQTLDYNVSSTARNYEFTIRITSETTADIELVVDGTTTKRLMNVTMNGTAGTNISHFVLFLNDDWNGAANSNIYWKQTTSHNATGTVNLGYYLASGTYTPGLVKNGLTSTSTSTSNTNNVNIGGDSGSSVLLSNANTYSGTMTVNANATLKLGTSSTSSSSGPLGTTAAGTTVSSGGVLDMNGYSLNSSATESLTLNGGGISGGGALTNSNLTASEWKGTVALGSDATIGGSGNITLSGVISGTFNLTKTGTATAILSATNTFGGSGKSIKIEQGTVSMSSFANNLGDVSNTISMGTASSSGTLKTTGTVTGSVSRSFTINAGGGSLEIAGTGTPTFSSSSGTYTGTLNGEFIVNCSSTGGVQFNLAMSGSGGMTINSSSSGIVTMGTAGAAASTYSGDTKITSGKLELGVANILPNSSKLFLNGGTFSSGSSTGYGETMGTLQLNENSIIALGSGSHTLTFSSSDAISWTSGKTLTVTGWTGTTGSSGTAGKIFVGASASGLTTSQLAMINFSGVPATILASGEIVPAATQYRSVTSGNWNSNATWEKSTDGTTWSAAVATPTNADGIITVRNTHIVTVTASVTVDQLTIDSGGSLILSAGTLTIANGSESNDLIIRGTYQRTSAATTMSINGGAAVLCDNGGSYSHNATGNSLPVITWADGSELKIENSLQVGLDQSFWNVRITGGSASSITFNDNVSRTMTVRNNFTLESGTFYLKNGGAVGGNHVLRVKGNFIQSGGSFSWNQSSSDNTSVVKLELEKDFIVSGGVWGGYVSATDCNSAVYFVGTGEQTYSTIIAHDAGGEMRNRFVYQTSSGPTGLNEVYNGSVKQYTIACTCVSVPAGFSKWPESGTLLKSMTVNNVNGVDLRHNRTINDSLYLKAGLLNHVSSTVTMADGTTIDRSGGTLSAAPTFGSSVNVIYTEHSSQNSTSFEIPISATVLNNLTINSSNGVLLSSNIQVNGTCLVSAGTLSLSDKTLTMGNNGIITNNSSINSGTSTVVFAGIGSIGGSSETTFNNVTINGSNGNAGVDFGANKSLINGTLIINTWGYAHNNAPKYGSSSNLIYNTGNVYDRRVEWGASGVGTISVTPGYPNNITISSNTTLNYAHETVGISKALFGDLTIDSGSSLYMDFGSPSPGISNPLTVNGDVLINGNLSLGNEIGGDIIVKGNWTRGSGSTFAPNNRAVMFTGTANQTINTFGGELFDYVILDNSNQLILASDAIIKKKIEMTSGDILTGTNIITLGTSTSEKGEIDWTAGLVYGKFARWFDGTNTGDASGFMPLGFDTNDRFVTVEFSSTPTTGGTLTAQWVSAQMGTSGLPISIPATGTCAAYNLVNTADDGYWKIDAGNGLSNDGSYDITLVGENVFGITNLCKLAAIKRVGVGNWLSSGTHVQPSGSISRPILKRTGATGWSNWGIGGGTENPLPIELSKFYSFCDNGQIIINWTTESETNNDYFSLEKSTDSKTWDVIANIAGAGNTTERKEYMFSYIENVSDIVYYRLKQTDFDGLSSYSNVIYNDCDKYSDLSFILYPNPNNGDFFILSNFEDNARYSAKITDASGKVILQRNNIVNNPESFDLSIIDAGFYILTINFGIESYSYKLIISK